MGSQFDKICHIDEHLADLLYRMHPMNGLGVAVAIVDQKGHPVSLKNHCGFLCLKDHMECLI